MNFFNTGVLAGDLKSSIIAQRPEMKKITLDSHLRRINTIYKHYPNESSILKILENYKDVFQFLEKTYTQQTYKSFVSSIIVALKGLNAPELLIGEYNDKLVSLGKEVEDFISKNEKTPKEEQNWVTQNEIKCKIKELEIKVSKLKATRGDNDYFDLYQQYMVLNLYHLIPPLRNDYVNTVVYETLSNFWLSMDKQTNYIFLKDKELVLNRYKTNKVYGTDNKRKLPDKLVEIVTKWMEIRVQIFPDLSSQKQLLLNLKKKTPMNQVNLTHYLNKIFKRKVSTTLLRKSFLSEKYPVTATGEEMKKDAQLMCHDIKTQQSTYRKKSTN